jgi:hypothetical protein
MDCSILSYWNSLGVCFRTCEVLRLKCDRKLTEYSEMRWRVHVCVYVCVLTAKTADFWFATDYLCKMYIVSANLSVFQCVTSGAHTMLELEES